MPTGHSGNTINHDRELTDSNMVIQSGIFQSTAYPDRLFISAKYVQFRAADRSLPPEWETCGASDGKMRRKLRIRAGARRKDLTSGLFGPFNSLTQLQRKNFWARSRWAAPHAIIRHRSKRYCPYAHPAGQAIRALRHVTAGRASPAPPPSRRAAARHRRCRQGQAGHRRRPDSASPDARVWGAG